LEIAKSYANAKQFDGLVELMVVLDKIAVNEQGHEQLEPFVPAIHLLCNVYLKQAQNYSSKGFQAARNMGEIFKLDGIK